ncbi:ABC transporter permease [Gemella cuniculi]|uniref:ABC transporter permease n=1 Tax=Gemella cuniculi TaxID=150240 RepID=UPI0004014F25|nr:ABC transporter permease [Gemella cuniculi]
MNNIKNIFSDRRKREREQRVTYSKYIFNSHLIMFLIIVLGAAMINYSKWLDNASDFELRVVFVSSTAILSYILVSLRVKTFIKEADSIFLLPIEKYYGKEILKTVLASTIKHLITLIIFYIVAKPILDRIGNIDKVTILTLIVIIFCNIGYRLQEVVYFGQKLSTKVLLFFSIFTQLIVLFLNPPYVVFLSLVIIAILVTIFVKEYNYKNKGIKFENGNYYLLRWNEAADYDKNRQESYLKFINMFVDVPLNNVKVARRKYFDILLPKLTQKNFNKENSFKYYYYRVFLRQENTIFLAVRLMLVAIVFIFSFKNQYVSAVTIISYSYLTIIQLVPLYNQIRNNIWHNVLPVDEEIKINSFKKLLTLVIGMTTLILTVVSIVLGQITLTYIGINIVALIVANLLASVFISKVK